MALVKSARKELFRCPKSQIPTHWCSAFEHQFLSFQMILLATGLAPLAWSLGRAGRRLRRIK